MDRILIVDDDRDLQEILTATLRMEGYEVKTAYSGKEALRQIKPDSPELVLVDVKMPGMSGLDVLEEIRKINKKSLVIMLTGYADIRDAVRSIKMGAHNYLTKPFEDDQLVEQVREALSSYHAGKNNGCTLSPREKEVLKWLKMGKSSWDISIILGISERTVNFHINNIMQKLDALTRTQAVAIAIEHELIDA